MPRDDFYMTLRDCSGGKHLGHWGDFTDFAVESASPIREFPNYKGQRNFTGHYYSRTDGCLLPFESRLERKHLCLFDYHPEVVAMSVQPFKMRWRQDRATRSHVPDVFVRFSNGSALLVDVRPARRVKDSEDLFDAAQRLCDRTGWQYRVLSEPPSPRINNIEWLAGYRRHMPCYSELRLAVREMAGVERMRIGDFARVLGTPVATATVYHLLWHHELQVDVDRQLLHLNTEVKA